MAVTGSGSTMGNIRRVVVGLKSRDASGVILANFIDCIVNYFNPNGLSARLCCNLENNILVLGPPPDADKLEDCDNKAFLVQSRPTTVTLQHSPACPLWHLGLDSDVVLPPEKLDQGVQVGVATILESSDEHILITQRADHMRTFPRAWVPPGGHVEAGETLVEGALRELEEETGLDLNVLPHRTQLLCLWESVFPLALGMGNPRNHHIVVYIHTKVDTPWNELHTKLKLDPGEVQGCVWLSPRDVASICSGTTEPVSVDKYVVGPDTQLVSKPLNLSRLFPYYVPGQNYSGLQLALNTWLQVKSGEAKHSCKM